MNVWIVLMMPKGVYETGERRDARYSYLVDFMDGRRETHHNHESQPHYWPDEETMKSVKKITWIRRETFTRTRETTVVGFERSAAALAPERSDAGNG